MKQKMNIAQISRTSNWERGHLVRRTRGFARRALSLAAGWLIAATGVLAKPRTADKMSALQVAQISRTVLWLGLIFCVGLTAARAQVPNGTVIPRVCVETTYQTGTATLAANAAVGDFAISVNGYVPPFVSLVINPGGANEEAILYVGVGITGNNPYRLRLHDNLTGALASRDGLGSESYQRLARAHNAGEIVQFAGNSGTAYFGYHNTSNAAVTILKGLINFFSPGPLSYPSQPTQFQPGIYEKVFGLPFGGQTADTLTWNLNRGQATAGNRGGQHCSTINYQGRLTDGAAANGRYDLRFTVFEAVTGGTAQSETITVEGVQVVNGVFTVPLNFGSSFLDNNPARFLEIGVRRGTAPATDPFTTLAPRQPITDVPFAVNAQKAFSVSGGLVQLPLTRGVPLGGCGEAAEHGQTRVDATNNRLYVCTATGWKSTVLQ